MAVVAGVDFGTLSVRVSIVDSERGMIASAVSEYPLHRKREDPEGATQSHEDHMRALAAATREAVKQAGISGEKVEAIALDTTGSSVIPVSKDLQPLSEYYLWCDHRAKSEAEEITAAAHREKLEAIEWCGGVYSSEWGFSKLLHWMRHNPEKRKDFVSASPRNHAGLEFAIGCTQTCWPAQCSCRQKALPVWVLRFLHFWQRALSKLLKKRKIKFVPRTGYLSPTPPNGASMTIFIAYLAACTSRLARNKLRWAMCCLR
jgi:FGGY family of carbohydrate kinases, N-terminal domain